MKKREEIIKAIEDSKKFAKEQKINYKKPVISFNELEKGIKALAVANEICTLNWVLGKGKLNCYEEIKDRNGNKKEIEFLRESNAIEGEYSEEALEDAKHAWNFAKKHKHNRIDIEFIKLIHQELMRRLNPRIAGEIRKCDVWIGGRKGYNPKEIKEELRLLCNFGIYPVLSEDLIKRWHIQFEKIHPFEDGNGRVGRIIMNIQRLKIDLPLLIIHEGEEQQEYYRWFK